MRYRRVDPRDPSAVAPTREELIQALNAERIRAGVSPLKVQPVLTRVAQARADEIEKRGALPNGAESTRMLGVVQRRLVDQGYTAHGWVESVVSSDGDAAEVIAYWRTDPSWGDLLRADYSDLGIGEARLGQVPLYLLLVAKPESEVYDVEVHDLTDLGATRAAMLAGVNRLRAEAGVPPLAENARLDAAAQEHAEDMLARNYYEHKSPEGKTA
ncbi:MAG: CAP domain-containing protein [Acidobacteriota bacterium]